MEGTRVTVAKMLREGLFEKVTGKIPKRREGVRYMKLQGNTFRQEDWQVWRCSEREGKVHSRIPKVIVAGI